MKNKLWNLIRSRGDFNLDVGLIDLIPVLIISIAMLFVHLTWSFLSGWTFAIWILAVAFSLWVTLRVPSYDPDEESDVE